MVNTTLKALAGVAALLCVANAAPPEVAPLSGVGSIPQEFVDEVLAYFNLPPVSGSTKRDVQNALHKRLPTNQGCDHPTEWVARSCLSDIGSREYEDECQTAYGEFYLTDGICPEYTYCSEVIEQGDGHEVHDIICVPLTPPRQDNVGTVGQYGYRNVQAVTQRGVTQLDESISLQADIAGASVSAQLHSTDRTFVINPSNALTANLRGHQLNVCHEDKRNTRHDSRLCKPTSRVDLKEGNTLDITFGLSPGQSGILFYSILRS